MKIVLFLLTALLVALAPHPAGAADVGGFTRPVGQIAAPVNGKTWTFDTSDFSIKAYRNDAWEKLTVPKIQYNGIGAPTVDEDVSAGYGPGAWYFNTSTKHWYICQDATDGAAVWKNITDVVSTNDTAKKLTIADIGTDWLVSGLLGSDPGASLAMTTPSGIAYVGGTRLTTGSFPNTYTASKDTYEYLQADGTMLRVAVNNNDSAPSGQPGLPIQKVVSDGSEITSVVSLAPTLPKLSVLAATANAHAVNLGQADARYAPIYVFSHVVGQKVWAGPPSSTGPPDFVDITNAYLPTVDATHGGLGYSYPSPTALGLLVGDGTGFAQVTAPTNPLYALRANSSNNAFEWYSPITSIGISVPSWLSAGSALTANGTIPITPATGQTARRVIGTGAGSTFGVHALENADLPVVDKSHGGTGQSSYTAGDILIVNNSGDIVKLGIGSNTGDVLTTDLTQNPKAKWATPGATSTVFPIVNGGRLTLTSGASVADAAAQGTLYWTPHKNGIISLYDGANYVNVLAGEKSLALTVTSGNNYTVYGSLSGGTLSLSLSAAWSNATTRGFTIDRDSSGVLSLSTDRTKRYLGDIYASGTNQVTDDSSIRGLYNVDNQVARLMSAVDTTNTWNYTTDAYRSFNNSTTNGVGQVTFLVGESSTIDARATGAATSTNATAIPIIGIGLDSTTVNSAINNWGGFTGVGVTNLTIPLHAEYSGVVSVGRHFLAPLERSTTGGTTTWYGDNNGTAIQTGLKARIMN